MKCFVSGSFQATLTSGRILTIVNHLASLFLTSLLLSMDNGLTLFMSQETRDKVDDNIFQTGTPIIDNQEVVEVVDVDV